MELERAAEQLRLDLKAAGVSRAVLYEQSATRQPVRVHDLRATFVTVSLANGKNEGWVMDRTGHTTPHMLLYHVNVGWPVLDDGAELLVPARSVEPRGSHSVEGYERFHGPEAGYVEQVFEHDVAAEAGGTVPVAIVNRRLGLGAYEVFRRDQLPFHFVWRMLGEGTYACGIEPCTNRTAGRLDARERGELIELAPGESRVYDLELGALDGDEAVAAFASRVSALVKEAPG